MTSRKTQQEIDKTFKKVAEGIQAFEGIYEKIRSTTNPAQRDKLEDNLKREIKKLQRFRDQIKSWAAGNEVKDKSPLLEQRRAIETVGYHHPLSFSCSGCLVLQLSIWESAFDKQEQICGIGR